MLKGKQSWMFENKPVIVNAATIVGPDEGKGPLGNDFDRIHGDWKVGQDSWEKAERALLEEAVQLTLQKANVQQSDVQFLVGGDLMNQIISSTFAARTLAIPYIGVFGACSTSMESLALASLIVNSGNAKYAIAATSSHNASAEKQFRFPTEYGAQKPPTAQYTVTGAGAALIGKTGSGAIITGATIGKVVDMGLTDPFNMGAAMAPAAVDTMIAHFNDFERQPSYYDMIVTGDLAQVGYDIARDLLKNANIPIQQTEYYDCGLLVYDREKQTVQAGGSGCACSAVVTYGHLLKRVTSGDLKRILVIATGALLSTISFQQGESIPCIAHAVAIEYGGA